MKHILLILCVVVSVLLCSCELAYEKHDPAPEVGTVRILVYGNDFFEEFTSSDKRLPDAVNDAYSVGRALSCLCDKAGYVYEVSYLLSPAWSTQRGLSSDGNADYQTVIQKLSELAYSSSEKDIAFLYFASHGVGPQKKVDYGQNVQDGYSICFSDAFSSNYVEMPIKDLMQMIKQIKGVKVVLGDFCYSGSLVNQGNISVGSGDYENSSISKLFDMGWNVCKEDSSTYVLSASRYYETSHGNKAYGPYRHGYFTVALLKALGWNEDSFMIEEVKALDPKGRLTLLNLANYVILNDGNASQTPMVSGGSNDIVLFSL